MSPSSSGRNISFQTFCTDTQIHMLTLWICNFAERADWGSSVQADPEGSLRRMATCLYCATKKNIEDIETHVLAQMCTEEACYSPASNS